jgi:hypothetical protein
MGKRLGIAGAGIAVVALVVAAVSPALGSSSQGAWVDSIRPRQQADDPRDCRVHRV